MFDTTKTMPGRRAFTLMELLVVVAIIALLVAILAPALMRVPFVVRTAICGSGQRQFVLATALYANDERGCLPRYDMGQDGRSSGNNLWDLHMSFYERLKEGYGVPHEAFFCPFTDKDHVGADFLTVGWKRYGFALLTSSYWVPRLISRGLGPPELSDPGTFVILDTEEFRGPARLDDVLARDNPVLTDAIITSPGIGPDVDLASDPTVHGSTFRLHLYRGVLDSINCAYVDGSVRNVDGQDVRPRFFGNWWNWR
jgi:prepilin-type N-terminal cleavage/methylation domain-containing protein